MCTSSIVLYSTVQCKLHFRDLIGVTIFNLVTSWIVSLTLWILIMINPNNGIQGLASVSVLDCIGNGDDGMGRSCTDQLDATC